MAGRKPIEDGLVERAAAMYRERLDVKVVDICKQFGISIATLNRYLATVNVQRREAKRTQQGEMKRAGLLVNERTLRKDLLSLFGDEHVDANVPVDELITMVIQLVKASVGPTEGSHANA